MSVLRIQKESLPTRCEICHQADLFDPEQNACVRCDGVSVPQPRIISAPATTLVLPDFLQKQIRMYEFHSQAENRRYHRQCGWVLGVLACFYWVYGGTFLFFLVQENIDRAELRRPHTTSQAKPSAPREEKSSWGVKPDTLPSDILRDHKGNPVYLTEKQLRKLAVHVHPWLMSSCTIGSTALDFIIDEKGKVFKIWVRSEKRASAGCLPTDSLLIGSFAWEFHPFLYQGKPKAVCATYEFVFSDYCHWSNPLPYEAKRLFGYDDMPPPPPRTNPN